MNWDRIIITLIRVDTDRNEVLMDIDDTNKDILRLLRDNGRMSFTEIGESLGLSRVAVKKRVKKLEETGIIRGYKAVIYRADNVKMLMEITTVDDDYEDLLEYLFPQVPLIHWVCGRTVLLRPQSIQEIWSITTGRAMCLIGKTL